MLLTWHAAQVAVCAALSYQSWGQPVAFVPLKAVGLMATRIAFPHSWPVADGDCAVSMVGWMLFCESASGLLVRSVDAMIRR